MANRGRHQFTVQESVNMDSYLSWNYESKPMTVADTYYEYTYVTAADPAKKVVIYQTPGDAAFDTGEVITVKINGNTDAGKEIAVNFDDLPFTLTGLSINNVAIKGSDATAVNDISVLSFH